MVVPITPKGSTVEAGQPVALFMMPPSSDYEVTRDGQRILINKVVKESRTNHRSAQLEAGKIGVPDRGANSPSESYRRNRPR
jgi:hypothetical protein